MRHSFNLLFGLLFGWRFAFAPHFHMTALGTACCRSVGSKPSIHSGWHQPLLVHLLKQKCTKDAAFPSLCQGGGNVCSGFS